MKIACGEYLFFMDNDDLITKTALEELYTIAKNFNADVVHCEKYYQFTNNPADYQTVSCNTKNSIDYPTLMSDKIEDRINALINHNIFWNLWTKLIRKNYLIENDIEFINAIAQDVAFTCCLVCSAKKCVRVPNGINFYRIISSSLQHQYTPNDVKKRINLWMNSLVESFIFLEKFFGNLEDFQQRTNLKYMVFDVIMQEFMQYILPIYAKVPAFQLDEIIRAELAKVDNKDALMAFIFSRMNIFNLNLIQQQQVIRQLQK